MNQAWVPYPAYQNREGWESLLADQDKQKIINRRGKIIGLPVAGDIGLRIIWNMNVAENAISCNIRMMPTGKQSIR